MSGITLKVSKEENAEVCSKEIKAYSQEHKWDLEADNSITLVRE